MRYSACLAVFAFVLSACNGDKAIGPEPITGGKQVRILGGEGASDTVQAASPSAPLVVEVRGEKGELVSGAVVRFTAIPPADTLRRGETGMIVCPITAPACGGGSGPYQNWYGQTPSFATATTSSDGRASVLLAYGTVAGTTGIVIEVPSLGIKDTAGFVVRPGDAARIRILPRDTALVVGKTFTVRSSVVDRLGNARTEAVTLTTANTSVATVSGKVVTSKAIGSSMLVATSGTIRPDTTTVNVVPAGSIAWGAGGIFTANFDGTGFRKLVASGGVPTWIPGEDALIYATSADYYGSPHLAIVTGNGTVTNVVVDATQTSAEFYPTMSPDGQWIYFSGTGPNSFGTWQLYRIRRNGTGQERLSPDLMHTDWRADVSPDGTRIVYVSTRSGGVGISVMNIGTRGVTHLTSYAQSPKWSPDGQQIAFVNGGLFVISPTGTGMRRVSAPNRGFYETVDWSADGQWLVSADDRGPVLVNVATGMEVRTALKQGAVVSVKP